VMVLFTAYPGYTDNELSHRQEPQGEEAERKLASGEAGVQPPPDYNLPYR